jgi:D-arabinose 1-dehydrogenase-like Zn-dependent alcohol dehydrogenase
MVLTKNGRLVLPAFAPIDLPLIGGSGPGPMVNFVAHHVSTTGSFLGSRADTPAMLTLAKQHSTSPRIELMPMAQVNESMLRVHQIQAPY